MAFLAITEGCHAQDCRMRARAEQALCSVSSEERPPRYCDMGLESVFAQRIYTHVAAREGLEESAPYMFCRIDPGLVGRAHARILVRLHRGCDESRCRPKLRGLQALAPVPYNCLPPRCRVPDRDIVLAVADYRGTWEVLQAVKQAFYARRPEAAEAMTIAIANFAMARRRRDALFLRALPEDGTVPTIVLAKFRIDYLDLNRILPNFAWPLPSPSGFSEP
ncbi:hypothetical protein ACFU44_16145 [Nocardia rhizosphaerihabitans]|uniref:hypothetical protein n=1 Tax=Nocardia rhizosphaerihabitans TaxID=1691570 RepID=UPI00366B2D7D